MDDILLKFSDLDTLEKRFKERQRVWHALAALEKRERENPINYLGYKICYEISITRVYVIVGNQ